LEGRIARARHGHLGAAFHGGLWAGHWGSRARMGPRLAAAYRSGGGRATAMLPGAESCSAGRGRIQKARSGILIRTGPCPGRIGVPGTLYHSVEATHEAGAS